MYRGRLLGVTVRGAFDAAALDRAARVACDCLPARSLGAPGVTGLGLMLAPTAAAPLGPDFDGYLRAAAEDGPRLESIFSVRDRLAATLGRLAGTTAEVPRHHDGRSYTWATLRLVEPDRGIDEHCDTYAPSPTFEHLHQVTDRSTQLSWYVVARAPERGGVLELRGARDRTPGRSCDPVPLGGGDLVLFDAGRQFHRITRVDGAAARVTLGGFAARRRDGAGLYFWG